jgi:hypothetical protein
VLYPPLLDMHAISFSKAFSILRGGTVAKAIFGTVLVEKRREKV